MERNWLIRTSQNQILGPVAKAKVLEFLQKGALGPNDEVTSGNGYWFFLKERDLVDKYLNGDVPQGYNPISESKSVLSRRENPDKTTSLNNSPANKTQSLKLEAQEPVVLPSNDDLEFPDITLVNNNVAAQFKSEAVAAKSKEEIKIPAPDDLEFPDITLITSSVGGSSKAASASEDLEISGTDEPIVYPDNSDLDYPDMSKIIAAENESDTLVLSLAEKELTLEILAPMTLEQDEKAELSEWDEANLPASKKVKIKAAPAPVSTPASAQPEEKKLLHERKVKASAKEQVTRVANKEVAAEKPPRVMAEHLKKRNDNYLMYVLVILVLIIIGLFFYYYSSILNKPLPV